MLQVIIQYRNRVHKEAAVLQILSQLQPKTNRRPRDPRHPVQFQKFIDLYWFIPVGEGVVCVKWH